MSTGIELVVKSKLPISLAYDFLRNDRLDAANFFAQPGNKPMLVQNQYGGSLGGPMVKNHGWIFGAYEGIHTPVPEPALLTGSAWLP